MSKKGKFQEPDPRVGTCGTCGKVQTLAQKMWRLFNDDGMGRGWDRCDDCPEGTVTWGPASG